MELLTVKGKTYVLKLRSAGILLVEKKLNKSIFKVLGNPDKDGGVELPKFEDLATLLWGCMQGEKNFTYEDALNLIDEFTEEGGTLLELFQILANSLGFTKPAV